MARSRAEELERVIGSFSTLNIVLHDNPDPDAISSALALSLVCAGKGVKIRLLARGSIGFEENRILLRALGADVVIVDDVFHPSAGEGVALVDNSIPGENNPLDPETRPDIVIDHHSTVKVPEDWGENVFLHIDPERCATASIMVDYLRDLGIAPSPTLSSGIVYGMMVDTRRFVLNMSDKDYENLAFAARNCDRKLLSSLESPPLDADTLEVLSRAIQNKELKEGFSMACVDYVQNQDTLARAADLLLRERGVHTSMVFGIMQDRIYISARTNREDLHIGNILGRAFGDMGFAGGHVHSAGARLPLGILAFANPETPEERRAVASIVHRAIGERFLDAVLGGK